MGEWHLKDSTPVLSVRTETLIRIEDFSTALAENFYMKSLDFPEKLTKKEAYKILKHRLYFHGKNGELPDGFFDASFEEGEIFNNLYDKAKEWILEKYEHYKTSHL